MMVEVVNCYTGYNGDYNNIDNDYNCNDIANNGWQWRIVGGYGGGLLL